ncbi:MAG TPA: hypothetical protein GX706_04060 [Candidatus Moranbacteria bacterium]|nr:hypothetical protein [Candidatus Moranbacteria bacterium]
MPEQKKGFELGKQKDDIFEQRKEQERSPVESLVEKEEDMKLERGLSQIPDRENFQEQEKISEPEQPETEKESSKEKSAEVDLEEKEIRERFVRKIAADITKIEDIEERIRKIVELATEKGPFLAVEVAKRLDYYTLDRVHDTLVTPEVRKALFEKGLLKEI